MQIIIRTDTMEISDGTVMVNIPDELHESVTSLADLLQSVDTPEKKALSFIEQNADEKTLLSMPEVFDLWAVGLNLSVGKVLRFNGDLWRVLQAHRSQSDWLPPDVPALYLRIVEPGVIPEWRQPQGAHDAYQKGDKVLFDGKTYESLIDANTWSPTAYPDGWKIRPDLN